MLERASSLGNVERLIGALDCFRCSRDTDIEMFLRDRAVEFLRRGWCSVYLILDEDAFDSGALKIIAYFTLSNKVLDLPYGELSKSKIKEVSGTKDAEYVHFILIGQLGKFINEVGHSEITAKEILEYAFEIIYNVNYLIPCRCTLVECSNEKKIHEVYENNGFVYFQFDGEHHQFYKRI